MGLEPTTSTMAIVGTSPEATAVPTECSRTAQDDLRLEPLVVLLRTHDA
jgi:hypothetical protein